MSKTKGQTFRYYRFWTKQKRFGIVSEFVLLKTDCFDLVQNPALLCPVFLTNLEGKVGKVGRVGKVGKVGKEGRLRE
jgi:hypothetical protein